MIVETYIYYILLIRHSDMQEVDCDDGVFVVSPILDYPEMTTTFDTESCVWNLIVDCTQLANIMGHVFDDRDRNGIKFQNEMGI